ncbi:MAG: AMP-binding protein, partial [bacterium]|nr:AMP-binding protein [bacterium]
MNINNYPNDKTIPYLFEEQVRKTPNRTALIGPVNGEWNLAKKYREKQDRTIPRGSVSITYQQLNEISSRLARNLLKQDIKTGTAVGIMTYNTVEMIVAILGVLKAGCSYVPLNPEVPAARTDYILEECRAEQLLTTRTLFKEVDLVDRWKGTILFIEDYCPGGNQYREDDKNSERPLLPTIEPNTLAYIVFTSGSTGKPKGVPITHANLSPLLHWGYDHLNMGTGDRVIKNIPTYFDWSLWETIITLTTGACLYVVPQKTLRDPAASLAFIKEHNITTLHITPTRYNDLVEREEQKPPLKYLFLQTEQQEIEQRSPILQPVAKQCRIFNMVVQTQQPEEGMESAERQPRKKISEINLISKEEKEKILFEFNDTETRYPKDKTIHELFEQQARQTPDRVAVVGIGDTPGQSNHTLTYRELNEASNRHARALQSKGVKQESIVAIMAESTPQVITAILG